MAGDPYANNGGRPNNQVNDPYTKRDAYGTKDVYRNNNAYTTKNVWKKDNPYETDGEQEKEKSKPCDFWFTCKMKMQDIFSTDSGAQAEGRVFNTDTDPFILSFFIKFSVYSFSNLFIVPLVMIGLFIASIYATQEIKLVIFFAEAFYIAYILYCPAWQTYTSGQYAVTKTGEEFYSKWLKGYKGYEGSTIFGFTLSVVSIALLAKYRFPFVYIYDYLEFPLPPEEQFRDGVLFLVGTSIIFLILYFVLVIVLKRKDAQNQKVNKRINIDSRTKSILGQLNVLMDSAD